MKTISLHGTWQLSPLDKTALVAQLSDPLVGTSFSDGIPLNIPGDIHSALLDKKNICDPYYAKNELDIQWVGRTDWTCTREIQVPKDFKDGRQFIVLECADTFVRVFINDAEVGMCFNMFRLWRFDVTDFLTAGKNVITLQFEASERYAIDAASKIPYEIPCSIYDVSSPNRNLVRKAQCHAGWDWGPCIMAFGVYDSIQLEQCSNGHIDYVESRTVPVCSCGAAQGDFSHIVEADILAGVEWNVNVGITYTSFDAGTLPITVIIEGKSIKTAINHAFTAQVTQGENRIECTLTVSKPDLWYPAGCRPEDDDAIAKTGFPTLTENTLYELTVQAGSHAITKKIAFRTVETVAKEDKDGKSLYFKVNGRAIFSKGANWIPGDALPSRITDEKLDYLLDTMVKSNQNTIRVWGGGRYESDVFYELCDKKGLLVWQDCMFACSTYPSNKEFLDNVRHEIRHQIRRLQHHACIILWCGNNEDLGALTWYEASRKNPSRYLVDYDRLNEGVIGDEVQRLDPDRAWWPSSPSAGPNDFSDNWHADGRGDMHYWSVWHEKKSFDAYLSIKPRFVSEFGYQSFPSLEEVKSYTPDDQLNFTSPVMEFHQRSPGGNAIILENFTRYFRFPEGLHAMLYLSQVQQALAIKTAVEYWRTLRPVCMGAIYWQLNDVWPIASWSSLEYSGRWKLLHYEVKKFFAPLTTVLTQKDDGIQAFVLNDTRKTVNGELIMSIIDFDGKILDKKSIKKGFVADKVDATWEIKLADLPVVAEECFVYAEFVTGDYRADTTLFPTFHKKCNLQKATIIVEVDDNLLVTLTADKPTFYVALQTDINGTFSTNMLTLLPKKPVTVQFDPDASLVAYSAKGESKRPTAQDLAKSLTVTSLRDTYK